MSYLSPYVNFNCAYLKIGLWDLFPVLLECITYVMRSEKTRQMSQKNHFEKWLEIVRKLVYYSIELLNII